MTCHEARERFSALLDDALGADERRALDAHLATCADCGRELQRFRSAVTLLRSVEPARAPAGFVDRVLDAARPAPWPRRLLRALVLPWPLKLPVEAAAIVLVAVGVVYVFRATPELEQATRVESTSKTDTTASQTESTTTYRAPTTTSRDIASEPAAPAAPREMSQPPEKAQAPKDQFAEKKLAAPPTTVRKDDAPRAPDPDDASRDVERLKRESPPAPSAEPQAGGKLAAPPVRAERERGVAQESQRLPAAPAPESRADTQRAFSSTAASVAAPDVSGRLAVADETAALRGLAHLVDRLGAVENRRVPGDAGPIIEVTVPREAYAEFVRELTRLGRWEVTREAATLPAQVRVVLQITG
jgi:hypothetical protein